MIFLTESLRALEILTADYHIHKAMLKLELCPLEALRQLLSTQAMMKP